MKKYILKKIKLIPCFSCILLLFLLAIYISYDVLTHPKEITIAVGKKSGAYYLYAKEYQERFKKYNVKLKIVPTKGALEAQERLIKNHVDFALVQGGLEKVDKGILALANVTYEPIWVLCRKESNITTFEALKGKRVNICNPSSGTAPVAREMLSELLGFKAKELATFHVNDAFQKLLVDTPPHK